MTVLDDIDAARTDVTLTPTRRNRVIARLKAQEWQRLQAALPIERTFGSGRRQVTVTITGLSVESRLDRDGERAWWLRVDGTDSQGLVPWPWLVSNPPLLVPDPTGPIVRYGEDETGMVEIRYRFDVAEALRGALAHMLRTVGAQI